MVKTIEVKTDKEWTNLSEEEKKRIEKIAEMAEFVSTTVYFQPVNVYGNIVDRFRKKELESWEIRNLLQL